MLHTCIFLFLMNLQMLGWGYVCSFVAQICLFSLYGKRTFLSGNKYMLYGICFNKKGYLFLSPFRICTLASSSSLKQGAKWITSRKTSLSFSLPFFIFIFLWAVGSSVCIWYKHVSLFLIFT